MLDVPPQIIIVDDNENHLRAIVAAFQNEGISCLGLHYDPEAGLQKSHFRGVRLLFLDLHLLPAVPHSGNQHFALLAHILEENIDPNGGPFVLILWTSYDEEFEGLVDYLRHTKDLSQHARPIAVYTLPKDRFLHQNEQQVTDSTGLLEEINKAIHLEPQLVALFTWERDVLSAIRSTLASVINLIPSEKRLSSQFHTEVDHVLSHLAIAAAGAQNVSKDPRAALNASLVPILADRISNENVIGDFELWQSVFTTAAQVPPLEPTYAASINRMLHVALPDAETISETDWGAVVDLPKDWEDITTFTTRFDLTHSELIEKHFKVPPAHHDQCSMRLARIGAPCDYAQGRTGPIIYLVALEVPFDLPKGDKRSPAIWESSLLRLQSDRVFRLLVSPAFPVTVTTGQTDSWTVLYRLREQLLMQLIHSFGTYSTRPGVISLR